MSQLDQILEKYTAFECDVIAFSSEIVKPWCSACKDICCKVDYCREALDSAFLSLIRYLYRAGAAFSDGQGWLTETGCALTAGRPPICHEFLCNRILNSRFMPLGRYAIDVLSKLMTHIGWRAAGRRHLVEIMDPSDLLAIKPEVFGRRLIEAREAFRVLKSILAHQPVSENAVASLSRIARPPDTMNSRD